MNDSYLIVRRVPYEEPHHTQLEIVVSNGAFSGSTDIYCNVSDLADIGRVLQTFPKVVGDEYKYEYGSSDPDSNFYRNFIIRFYAVGSCGSCALQVEINQNQSEPNEGVCRFSLKAEPASINRLGDLFVAFSELQHLEFKWIPNTDFAELYKEYQTQNVTSFNR